MNDILLRGDPGDSANYEAWWTRFDDPIQAVDMVADVIGASEPGEEWRLPIRTSDPLRAVGGVSILAAIRDPGDIFDI